MGFIKETQYIHIANDHWVNKQVHRKKKRLIFFWKKSLSISVERGYDLPIFKNLPVIQFGMESVLGLERSSEIWGNLFMTLNWFGRRTSLIHTFLTTSAWISEESTAALWDYTFSLLWKTTDGNNVEPKMSSWLFYMMSHVKEVWLNE